MTSRESALPLVLIVEDYQDAREMYAEYLEFSGFRVAEARNGVEALEQASSLIPDIILMDLALPQIDGWEATRRLKRNPRTRHIPIVALTGHALSGHVEGAKNAGCDAFLAKPCLPDALVAEIQQILSRRQDTGGMLSQSPTSRVSSRRSSPGSTSAKSKSTRER